MKYARLLRQIPLSLIILSTAFGVRAADITVDANCALSDAIQAAESDSEVGGCTAGSGADTIHLTGTITLDSELPEIRSEITIAGKGYSIIGNNRGRILKISRRSTTTIRDLTLRNGRASTGGAIHNSGTLSIENCNFRDNETYSRDGGAILNLGRLTITDSVFVRNKSVQSHNTVASGGAIYNNQLGDIPSELTVINSTFRGNWAAWSGGAIANETGTVTIIDSRFDQNSAEYGGALDSDDALRVSGSVFSANSAITNSASGGGAIFSQGPLNVSDSQFIANTASARGGAIRGQRETTVSKSIFIDNASDLSGGAIDNDNGRFSVSGSYFTGNSSKWGGAVKSTDSGWDRTVQLIVSDSVFVQNSATETGGALFGNGIIVIARSSFVANTAEKYVGAMASYASHLTMTDSTFAGNSAGIAIGGLYVSVNDSAYLAHLTIVNNSAGEGGGIQVFHEEDAELALELHNSLIAANQGGDCVGQFAQNNRNMIADGSCDPALSGDPRLGTLVEPEDGAPAYFPLLPKSPAINAADPAQCSATDQIGTPRPQGAACDIGAIEFTRE